MYNLFDNPVIIEEEPQLRQPAIMSTEDGLTQLMHMILEDRKIEKKEQQKKEKLDKAEREAKEKRVKEFMKMIVEQQRKEGQKDREGTRTTTMND